MAARMKVLCNTRHAQMVTGYDSDGEQVTGEVVLQGKKPTCFRTYTFSAVFSTDPTHENKQFWEYTPILDITTSITNPEVDFEVGAEYNIEISRANSRSKTRASSASVTSASITAKEA